MHRERRGEKGMEKIKEKPNLRADPHCPKTEKGSTFLGGAVFERQMSVCGETKEGKALLKGEKKAKLLLLLPSLFWRARRETKFPFQASFALTHSHTKVPLIPHSGNVGEGGEKIRPNLSPGREGKK